MLTYWANDRGVVLYAVPPAGMNDPVGTDDPVQALKQNLILFIADQFSYEPTQAQKSNAARAFRVLKARSRGPALMNMQPNTPRGSGNTWYNACVSDCSNGSQSIVTETNVQVVSE